jgi:hypothetical protein
MSPQNARDAVPVSYGKRLQTAHGGLSEELIAPAPPRKKQEIGRAIEFSVVGLHVPHSFYPRSIVNAPGLTMSELLQLVVDNVR